MVCESKEAKQGKRGKRTRKPLKAENILDPKYWTDQQRGGLEFDGQFANNLTYTRHMVPFFAEIPTGMSLFQYREEKDWFEAGFEIYGGN